jgi:hypothetical protein
VCRVVAGRGSHLSKFGKPYAFFKKISRFIFFLFSEIQYRKTKWDSGAFFPVADPQLGTEVSDEARTWTNRLVGVPPPVLVGRVRVGHGHHGGGLDDFQWAEWWLVECQKGKGGHMGGIFQRDLNPGSATMTPVIFSMTCPCMFVFVQK